MDQQTQAYESQLQQSQQQIEAQQRQIEALQRQSQQQHTNPQLDGLTEKLKKYADLKQQGILTEEEFQKLKMDLLSKL